jgi:hypothetical protein
MSEALENGALVPSSIEYASFLIRLWRETIAGVGDMTGAWHIGVEHIQTGERQDFSTLDELVAFLHQKTENAAAAQSPEYWGT